MDFEEPSKPYRRKTNDNVGYIIEGVEETELEKILRKNEYCKSLKKDQEFVEILDKPDGSLLPEPSTSNQEDIQIIGKRRGQIHDEFPALGVVTRLPIPQAIAQTEEVTLQPQAAGKVFQQSFIHSI